MYYNQNPNLNPNSGPPQLPPRRVSDYGQVPPQQQQQQHAGSHNPYVAFPAPHNMHGNHAAAPYPAVPAYPTPTTSPYGHSVNNHPYAAPSSSSSSSYHSLPHTPPAIQSTNSSDLERKLQTERDERRKLEEREFERIKAMSALEEQVRKLNLDMDRSSGDRASQLAQIESRLQYEQDEKRRLQERLATTAEIESRLQHEQSERRNLEQRLATFPATVAELERRVTLEREERRKVEEQVKRLNDIEPLLKAEKEEKVRVEQRLSEIEAQLRASQKALADLGVAKADMAMNIENKNAEIAELKRQLDPANMDRQRAELEAQKVELERRLKEKDAELDGLARAKDVELARLSDALNRESFERSNIVQHLHALQAKYEGRPPPVGDESVYAKPPPEKPLPIPKGVDHDLWQMYIRADPYQLKAINAVQLHEILMHNGLWPPLEFSTVQTLHSLYDRTGTSFSFDHFSALWELLTSWLVHFRASDNHQTEDEFGYIERSDLRAVLKKCGIAASERSLTGVLTRNYQHERPLSWDDFVNLASKLKIVLDAFQKIDMDRDAWITISRDQFVDTVVNASV